MRTIYIINIYYVLLVLVRRTHFKLLLRALILDYITVRHPYSIRLAIPPGRHWWEYRERPLLHRLTDTKLCLGLDIHLFSNTGTLASLSTAHNLLRALQKAAGHDLPTTTGVVYFAADNIKFIARDSNECTLQFVDCVFNLAHFFTPMGHGALTQ